MQTVLDLVALGERPNDGRGDTDRRAFEKVNAALTGLADDVGTLYDALAEGGLNFDDLLKRKLDASLVTPFALRLLAALNDQQMRDLLGLGNPITPRIVVDRDAMIAKTDTFVCLSRLTQKRVLTLPFASDYPRGQTLWIADESGSCAAGREIEVRRARTDTIAGQSLVLVASPYQKIALHSNGASLWTAM